MLAAARLPEPEDKRRRISESGDWVGTTEERRRMRRVEKREQKEREQIAHAKEARSKERQEWQTACAEIDATLVAWCRQGPVTPGGG